MWDENMRSNKKFIEIILAVIAGLAITTGIGYEVGHSQGLADLLSDTVAEEDQLSEEDLALIESIYNQIQTSYINDVDKKELLEGALKGMVEATGDPYSEFLDQDQTQDMNEDLSGSFSGIGVQITVQNNQVVVMTPIADTPAEKAGLLPKDIILKADNKDLSGMTANEVVQIIRGKKGTSVHLEIQRDQQTFEVDIKRDDIPIYTVEGDIAKSDKNVGIVKISQFNTTTAQELQDKVKELRKAGAKQFVFDLRNNPGGLMDQALSISNMFLEDKDTIMQVQEANTENPTVYVANDKEYGNFKIKEPYVLLVNDGSASASEILTAAIKENTDAKILGSKTFGKGTVQTVMPQGDYGELKLTIAKWLTPSGQWIHEKGIEPSQEVKADPIQTSILLNGEDQLSLGQHSDSVANLNVILNGMGYSANQKDEFDQDTEKAVKAFQKDHDLDQDGIVTGDTSAAINLAAQEYLQNHDGQLDQAIKILKEKN